MRPMLTVNRRADNRLIRSASKLPAWIVPFEHHRRTARTRIRKTVAFARSVKEEQYAGASGRKIKFVGAPGKVIRGDDYLLQMVIPNTFFHIAMAHAILRHNGVDVGKDGFSGAC